MVLLTVIMTARNSASTIRAAMTSTLRAMPRDAELLVLDDGSGDDTSAVAASVADRRVRVLRSEVTIGYVAGRRRLIGASDSRYVAIMDSDDVSFPWRFRHQLRALGGGPELVVSPVVSFRTGPLQVRPGSPTGVGAWTFAHYLALGCPFSHPTLTMSRAALERLGGYRDVVAEDYDLYARACLAGMRVERTTVPVLAYRRHGAQTSNNAGYDDAVEADARLQQTLDELRAALGCRQYAPADFAAAARLHGAGRIEARLLERYVRTRHRPGGMS